MFVDFFYHLRQFGLKVSTTEWLSLIRALSEGHARADLNTFYHLARCLLVKRESDYDTYDRAFASFFADLESATQLSEELLAWLSNPVLPHISESERAQLQAFELEELRERFRKILAEQKERHDGGNRWIGTGGTSPFGHGGTHPSGMRVSGVSGSRSAVQVAGSRRYRNLRHDRILDTRQIGVALRRLKRLDRDDGPAELDLEATIDQSARNGGEIELAFGPPRRNRVKLLLLMDVGGSMDPHTHLCERLFSAAHAANHFKHFEHRFFHNCVYQRVYTDMQTFQGERTVELLKRIDHTWSVIFVGDAWMAPSELVHSWGAIDFDHRNATAGITWLERIRQRVPNSVWLNPEPRVRWNEPSILLIRRIFPMCELTVDGLTQAVDMLRGTRPNRPSTA
jgi:uncharacterized protein with von Willebrand factor type A (vWA) domain